jgi:predicted HTH transcriptional regulator
MGETRNNEFKGTINWNDEDIKFKITKSILAMSNIRNGGNIIIGIEETHDKRYSDTGMGQIDFESFKKDNMKDHVGRYASPFAEFELIKKDFGEKNFLIITVDEFQLDPVICKRAYVINSKTELEEGDICTRTRNTKPQSSKVTSHIDLREILDLSIEKRMKNFYKFAQIAGLTGPPTEEKDDVQFEQQARGI